MASKLTIYVSSVSSNHEMKKHQIRIKDVLSSKKIAFEEIDVAEKKEFLHAMREIVADEGALPPQICRGDEYIGNYDAFEEAIEDGRLQEFLKC